MAASAIEPSVLVLGHEGALAVLALLPLWINSSILIDLEQLEQLHLLLLAGVWDTLLGSERLLLPLLLLTTTETKHKVQGRVLLDRVVLESVAILQLLAGEDQALLVWWDTFLVLDLSLDVLDSICWLNLKRNVLPCQSLNENLHQKGHTSTITAKSIEFPKRYDRINLYNIV